MAVDAEPRLADGEHVVHFYEDDEDLLPVVAGYLLGALDDGDAVVVIATGAHRTALERAFRAAGHGAPVDGQRVFLADAAETLSRFMVDGTPDEAAFDAVIGGMVGEAQRGGRPVRAYGEMVALLWAADDVAGALALEDLWNGLGQRTPLSLFCAYPRWLASQPGGSDAFSEVCDRHSHVVGGAPLPQDAERSRTFTNDSGAAYRARRFVGQVLEAWGWQALDDDCALVTTELATNAIRHAGTTFTVSLRRSATGVTVVVGDLSASPPIPREPDVERPGGRGMQLVDHFAAEWGCDRADRGKLVWAHVAGPHRPSGVE